jgi:hypothetical protein
MENGKIQVYFVFFPCDSTEKYPSIFQIIRAYFPRLGSGGTEDTKG